MFDPSALPMDRPDSPFGSYDTGHKFRQRRADGDNCQTHQRFAPSPAQGNGSGSVHSQVAAQCNADHPCRNQQEYLPDRRAAGRITGPGFAAGHGRPDQNHQIHDQSRQQDTSICTGNHVSHSQQSQQQRDAQIPGGVTVPGLPAHGKGRNQGAASHHHQRIEQVAANDIDSARALLFCRAAVRLTDSSGRMFPG